MMAPGPPASQLAVPELVPLLRVARGAALVAAIIGAAAVAAVVIAVLVDPGLLGPLLGWLVGLALVSVAGLLVRIQAPRIHRHLNASRYAKARDEALSWGIVGLFAFVVPGVYLLRVWSRINEELAGVPGVVASAAPPPAPTPAVVARPYAPPVGPPPITAPRPPAGPSVAVSGPPLCPRCGQPSTWIEQYRRWYCYRDQLYV